MPKTLHYRYPFVFLLVLVLAAVLVQGLLARPADIINPRDVDPNEIVDERMIFIVSNESPFEPTSNCKQCHRSITEEWYKSQHYNAWRDPIFQENYLAYREFLESPEPSPAFIPIVEAEDAKAAERPGKRKEHERPPEPPNKVEINVLTVKDNVISQKLHHDQNGLLPEGIVDNKIQSNCWRCHAPGADFTYDGEMVLQSNNEGIFCDYCHLIVDRSEEGFLLFPLSKIKQGPRIEPVTSSHPVEYSSLHTRSEFCKNCHQYTNAAGVKVLDTYSEWKTGPYSRATNPVSCQNCHMPAYRGRASVDGDIRPDVASHYFAGAYNSGFMIDAAICDIGEIEVTDIPGGYNINVPVEVINDRAGHDFPTGWPLRQLVLVVRLRSEDHFGTFSEGRVVYEKVYGDFWGNRTFNVWEITQVLSDTETWSEEGTPRGVGPLKAAEIRVEDINLTLPAEMYDEYEHGDLYVTAQLFFRITPEGFTSNVDLPSPLRLHADVEYVMLP